MSPATLAKVCKQWQITELAVFGSILRDDFNLNSDIDLLVTFHPEARITMFGLEAIEMGFQKLLQRPVDLVTKRAIERSHNWIRRQNILGNAKTIMSQDTEAQQQLPDLPNKLVSESAIITKDGTGDHSYELRFESLLETMEILSDREFMAQLQEGIRQADAGETISLEAVKAKLGF
ncbi:MAG: nucleotidyltransferase domain-containing protein [Hormoscilla sp. SP12CHS1]|nr:nucleotidyltransferase domain-containing protein [Hormoscilla sp. SP12CHS1]